MARPRNVSSQTRMVLAALLREPETWRHGYALSTLTGLKSGTLYPLLVRLSDQGFLDSEWQAADQPGRPPRHVYRLTRSGIALARAQIVENRAAAMGAYARVKPA